jgi:hypothetical protein
MLLAWDRAEKLPSTDNPGRLPHKCSPTQNSIPEYAILLKEYLSNWQAAKELYRAPTFLNRTEPGLNPDC